MRKPNLRLTDQQIADLGIYSKDRLASLREDNSARIKADKASWKTYERQRGDRAQPDTVYEQSNVSIPLASMVVDNFVSRADDAVTGTAPYFNFKGRGASDPIKAFECEQFFRYKLEKKGKTRAIMQDGYEPIFVQRAAFFKAIYSEKVDKWQDYEKRILWNAIEDEPIELIPPGQTEPVYIIEGEHEFIEVNDPVLGLRKQSATIPFFFLNEEIQEWRPSPNGLKYTNTLFKGVKAVHVDYDAILIPTTAEDVADADIIEMYDKPIEWAKNMWVERESMTFDAFKDKLNALDANSKTETERAKEGKENLSFDKKSGRVKVLECWFTRDVLETGEPQRIVVWVDADTFTPISWEYRSIVVPSGNTPYTAIAIGKKANRWWGRSLVEMVDDLQEFVDKQFNSQAARNELAANPLTGVDRGNLEDDEEDDVEVHVGKQFNVKPGKNIRDVFSFTEMPKLDSKTGELIDFVIEIVQLWLGVSDLSQGDSQDISKHNTATGIEATLREASKLSRKWIRRIVRGYSGLLDEMVSLTLATIDENEVFEVLEGEATFIRQMSAQELSSIDIDVSLVLTQNEGGRMIENARAAIETQQYYFDMLMTNPQMALLTRPMAVVILRELGFPDADSLLPAYGENPNASVEELQAMQQAHQAKLQQQAMAGGAKQDQKEVLPTR